MLAHLLEPDCRVLLEFLKAGDTLILGIFESGEPLGTFGTQLTPDRWVYYRAGNSEKMKDLLLKVYKGG